MNSIQNKGATLDVLNLPSMTGIADPNLRQLMTNLGPVVVDRVLQGFKAGVRMIVRNLDDDLSLRLWAFL